MREAFHNQVPFKLTQCEGKGFSLVHGEDHLSNHSRLGFVFQLFDAIYLVLYVHSRGTCLEYKAYRTILTRSLIDKCCGLNGGL